MAGPLENKLWALRRLSHYLVPLPEDRLPVTSSNVGYTLIPSFLLLTLAYLVRRPNTRLIRLAIMPFAIVATLRATFAYEWTDIRFIALECSDFGAKAPCQSPCFIYVIGLVGIGTVLKALEYGLAPKGILKIGEVEPGVVATPAIQLGHAVNGHKANGKPSSSPSKAAPRGSFIEGLGNALELLASMRGIGWQYGSGAQVYIPKETRDVKNTGRFLLQTLRSFIIHFLLTDFFEACIKLVPGIGTPAGDSIFAFGSNVVEKYAISTLLHVATGSGFILGLTMGYHLLTLLGIVFLGHSSTSWPPLFEYPWAADNLHSLWAKQWHQILRNTFLVMGGYPFQALFGPVGLVLGTFLASGLLHDWGMYTMGKGTDRMVWMFFTAQAFGLAAERLWRAATGRRVDGWIGRVWVWLFIIGGGQLCIDAWHRRGFVGGLIIPPVISPTRLYLFPFITRLLS